MTRLALVTDAWTPQVNGVVRTLERTVNLMRERGHGVEVIQPGLFRTVALPGYPEIRLATSLHRLRAMVDACRPDALHIATEGPLGIAAKLLADRRGWSYTTSYHTQFPEYVHARLGFGRQAAYAGMRWFHGRSRAVMVSTDGIAVQVAAHGLRRLARWGRGVDTALFTPHGSESALLDGLPRPLLLNVGRVAVEKNLTAFHGLRTSGTLVQVGDGPMLEQCRRERPGVVFLGALTGEALAAVYRSADVFVFPSRTDTFGLVMLESIASGVPVAAYPVTGPVDVVQDGRSGCLDHDLSLAVASALRLRCDPLAVRACALPLSWDACTEQFEANLVPLRSAHRGQRPPALPL